MKNNNRHVKTDTNNNSDAFESFATVIVRCAHKNNIMETRI